MVKFLRVKKLHAQSRLLHFLIEPRVQVHEFCLNRPIGIDLQQHVLVVSRCFNCSYNKVRFYRVDVLECVCIRATVLDYKQYCIAVFCNNINGIKVDKDAKSLIYKESCEFHKFT